MDRNLTYAKTPAGEEATRQRTRVVQRNLRMVLLQVDGQVTVDELIAKIGNEALVVNALRELEKGGYVCLAADAPSVWEQSKARIKTPAPAKSSSSRGPSASPISEASGLSESSDFSGFEPSIVEEAPTTLTASQFSTFGKPVLPVPAPAPVAPPPAPSLGEKIATGLGGLGERIRGVLSRDEGHREGRDLKPVRKIRIGPLVTGAVAGLLALGGAVVFLFPYNSYRPDIERALTATWGVPVRVNEVQARFLPRPGLVLSGVEFGNDGDARFGEILIPQLLSLGSGDRTIRDLVISNAVVKADFLSKLDAAGKKMVGGAAGFQVRHATLHHLSIMVGELSFRPYNGEAIFGKTGLEKISLENEERTLRFDVMPQAGGADLSAQGFAWKPGGEESSLVFASIQARGVLQAGKVALREVDANVLNGNVIGNLSLDWTQGLRMAGELQLTRLSARQISQTFKTGADVDGDVSGMMRYAGAGSQWNELWQSLDATLAMTMNRGAVNGVDLGEAARRGGGKAVGGGATRFDRLNCTLRVTPQAVSCSDIDLDAGLMTATGQFVARPDKSVDATLQVQIKSSVMPIRATTRVTGTLPLLQTMAGGK